MMTFDKRYLVGQTQSSSVFSTRILVFLFVDILLQQEQLDQMQAQDQMQRLIGLRYFVKKAKKVAAYMVEQKEEEVKLPLAEAIAMKRDASKMDDSYNPRKVQKYWTEFWQKNKFYHADNTTTNPKKFVICLPPPNVTGYLHIGHALTTAIEDSLVRWKRMSGFETLYVPGTDHAGIATQSVVEKKLMKEEGKTRHDFTREEFLKKVWEWKEKHGNQILEQLRRTGSSLDWDRTVFTMDEMLSKAVKEAFVRLYDKGLIYRANRLVNWSSILKTAISDIEVNFEDVEKRTFFEVPGYTQKIEFGVLIYFAYKLKQDPTKQIIVATTRIQTMLGDTAVAVHPEDQRYKHLIGKELLHPFIPDRKMTIVADTFVQKQFGTGAVKITPAHDPNDYACGQKHKLQFINIFTDDGLINENGGKFKGMKRFHARKAVEDELKTLGLWKEKKDNKMRLAFCQRSKDVVEPMIRPQWWVDCSKIKEPMLEVVKTKELEILPQEYENNWNRWIGDLRDWCISRQLWWGHRIPAYLVTKKGEEKSEKEIWVVGRDDKQALANAIKLTGLPAQQLILKQDEDVLDTWFSSGLFPFSVLHWPDTQNPDFKQFFPNSILQTGYDIIFFWVARMVMMSLWLTEKLPFKTVFLHPIVCDSEGEKMSKSKGNVIDPLEVIQGTPLDNLLNKLRDGNLPKKELQANIKKKQKEFPEGIPECGSDALRFGLLAYMVQSRSINLDIKRIAGYREFCNKIWNTFKFGYKQFAEAKQYDQKNLNPSKLHFLNKWILAKLNQSIKGVINNYSKYSFGLATTAFYSFWRYELCDVYLEATKPIFQGTNEELKKETSHVLFQCIETGLRLLHPMMPFLTEELYQKLPIWKDKRESISVHSYPVPLEVLYKDDKLEGHLAQIENEFETINKIAAGLRGIAASVNLPPKIRPHAYIISSQTFPPGHLQLISTLGKTCSVQQLKSQTDVPKGCGTSNLGTTTKIYVALKEYIDFGKENERLEKKKAELQKAIDNLKKKMESKDYKLKAKEEAQKENQESLEKYTQEWELVKEAIKKINELK